jgi:hypothetical protein
VPAQSKPWDVQIEGHAPTAAFIGLDAFSVPIPLSGGPKADSQRMLDVATRYPPDKKPTH